MPRITSASLHGVIGSGLNEKVTRRHEQIKDIDAQDPFINTQRWESSVEQSRTILETYIADFNAHLQEGYIVQE